MDETDKLAQVVYDAADKFNSALAQAAEAGLIIKVEVRQAPHTQSNYTVAALHVDILRPIEPQKKTTT